MKFKFLNQNKIREIKKQPQKREILRLLFTLWINCEKWVISFGANSILENSSLGLWWCYRVPIYLTFFVVKMIMKRKHWWHCIVSIMYILHIFMSYGFQYDCWYQLFLGFIFEAVYWLFLFMIVQPRYIQVSTNPFE